MAGLRALLRLLGQTAADWKEDNASRLAASLAYYSAISIAPLLVVVISLTGLFLGAEAARGEIIDELGGLIGHSTAAAVETMVAGANKPRSGVLATIAGVVVLIFGATGVFAELQDSLNTIWEVQQKPGRGLWTILRQRFLSLGMVLAVAFLLLVSLSLSAGLAALGERLRQVLPGTPLVWQVAGFTASFAVATVLFALIFKVLPDVKLRFGDVLVGAAVTAALFVIGKVLLGVYLAHAEATSSNGAAGAILALLLWVYYSAQIFFFGAEFTQAYVKSRGRKLEPTANAVAVSELEDAPAL